jgi:hypothetical protein
LESGLKFPADFAEILLIMQICSFLSFKAFNAHLKAMATHWPSIWAKEHIQAEAEKSELSSAFCRIR